jgi:hypothetical protein
MPGLDPVIVTQKKMAVSSTAMMRVVEFLSLVLVEPGFHQGGEGR